MDAKNFYQRFKNALTFLDVSWGSKVEVNFLLTNWGIKLKTTDGSVEIFLPKE